MKNLTCVVLTVALTVGTCWADGAPVAVRVEVEAREAGAEETRIDLVIQVSPEDRGRIGSNAMVRVELDGAAPPGQSPLWAVSLESDGSARIKTAWPPGDHDLLVTIESADRKHTGLWVGKVRVPGGGADGVAPVETESPDQTPEPDLPEPESPEVEEAGAAAAGSTAASDPDQIGPVETADAVTESADAELEDDIEPAAGQGGEEPVAETAVMAAGVASSAAREIEPGEEADDREDPPDNQPDERSPSTAADAGAAAAPVVVASAADMPAEDKETDQAGSDVAEVEAAESGTIEPPQEDIAEPAAVAAAAVSEPSGDVPLRSEISKTETPVEEMTSTPSPAEPVVVPLRSPDSVAPGEVSGPEPPSADALAVPSAEVAAEFESWTEAPAGSRDLTVVVTRNREPVEGLDREALRLRVGKVDVAIDRVGDRDRAPLNLGIAADLSAASASSWDRLSRSIGPLVLRTGGGQIFAATPGQLTNWRPGPVQPAEILAAANGGDLDQLIVSSLNRFEERRGRSFLILLTDGRSETTKEGWNRVSAAVAAAGVPVLAVALWDDGFSKKVRKQLSQLAEASGGRLFLAQGADQIGAAVERFGPLLDGGVALRFARPSSDRAQPVSVTAGDSKIQVSAPKSIQ